MSPPKPGNTEVAVRTAEDPGKGSLHDTRGAFRRGHERDLGLQAGRTKGKGDWVRLDPPRAGAEVGLSLRAFH